MHHHHHERSAHVDASAPAHDKHEGHSPEMFRDRLIVSLALTVPILYLSPPIQTWFGFEAVDFPGVDWVSPVLATALFLYAGAVFLRGAGREIAHRRPGMMTLVSVAISVAYTYSLAVSLGVDGEPFYWEFATLLDVMLLGHWIEMRSIQSASRALDHLASMVPATAHLVADDGSISAVPVDSVSRDDRVLVRPGEQVPIDGVISEGASSLDQAFLTGESRPVPVTIGDEVVAGSVNGEGVLTVVVTRVGDDTTLSQIMRLVDEAQQSRSRFQALADRAAMWLTLVAFAVAIPTFAAWALGGDDGLTFAVARAVTVLVIACPHALGLAIPLVTVNATGMAARRGVLVRDREAFERGSAIATVAFDKTGTLTEGRFAVSSVTTSGIEEAEALGLAAAVERGSEHPLAAAIVDAAHRAGIPVREGLAVSAVPGKGMQGTVAGKAVKVGRPQWADESGTPVPEDLEDALQSADSRGESAVVVMVDGVSVAVISLGDRIRPSAAAAIADLAGMGIEAVMITGDADAVAARVAREVGISRYHSRVLPDEKARLVTALREHGPTAFVGDGINDAPALLAADIGLAIGAGTNVAIESADLVLVDDDPGDVAFALGLARATSRKMRQNLAWATGYNVIALPLAAGVGAGVGLLLEPAVGAILMSLSTVIVAVNAMLLRRFDAGRGTQHHRATMTHNSLPDTESHHAEAP